MAENQFQFNLQTSVVAVIRLDLIYHPVEAGYWLINEVKGQFDDHLCLSGADRGDEC